MGDYVTLNEVKDYLGKDTTGQDTQIQELITQAEHRIESITETIFDASSNTNKTLDAIDNVDGDTLYLDTWLYSLNSITNGDGNSIATNVVILEPRTGPPYYAIKIRSDQSTTWTYGDYHEDAITINGAWGWSNAAPEQIKYAVKRLVKHWNHARLNSGDLDRPLLTGDGITIMPTTIPNDVEEILRQYKPVVSWP